MSSLTIYSVGGIIAALFVFIILKRVVGFVFRIILAAVLAAAIIIGAWWWLGSSDAKDGKDNRPQKTQRADED